MRGNGKSKQGWRYGAVAVLVVGQALAGVGAAAPASASDVRCKISNLACLYEDINGNGDEYGGVWRQGKYELGGWDGDNEISSVSNYSEWCMTLYTNDGWGGRTLTLGPKRSLYNLKDWGFNDDTESYRLHAC
ncbi:peptidase inhibitor family I36 protein [Spongiactinospora sp. TRM90649]|uniref:peptidase inhibitor family I36 protein n=1 Tax=Spongiactinospora sp. TRM90649 TaxID=3031114 RepID=UPI0023FA220F|nr:peptidase inhibitor family I36 protein [Spongiactinospora sp. TRM90649]MDF5759334.1 peptidase inhibitor family I36 protein [Spongiactinospora sp. TRM90649]